MKNIIPTTKPVITMTKPSNGDKATIVPGGGINVAVFVKEEEAKGFVLDSTFYTNKANEAHFSAFDPKTKPEDKETFLAEKERCFRLAAERRADEEQILG